jgi:hypothetical protein
MLFFKLYSVNINYIIFLFLFIFRIVLFFTKLYYLIAAIEKLDV